MPCSFCYCMPWGFLNVFWHDTFPDNSFSASTNDFCWWPWPHGNIELMSAFTFIHTSAVSTLFLSSLWIWSVFFTVFLMYLGKNLISVSCTVYVHFPYLTYLSSFQLLPILYLIYITFLVLITLYRYDFIQAGILFPFPHTQPNEMQNDWAYYAGIPYEQTLLLCFHSLHLLQTCHFNHFSPWVYLVCCLIIFLFLFQKLQVYQTQCLLRLHLFGMNIVTSESAGNLIPTPLSH